MGGTVSVESALGEGSVFTVALEVEELSPPPAPEPPAGTLLLVQEHDGARGAAAALAVALGLEVHAVTSADGARRWVADGGRYDLAALDVGQDDVLEAASDLRRHPAVGDRPLIALTPVGGRGGPLFDAVVTKPVRSDRFAEVVSRLTKPAAPGPDARAAPRTAGPLRVLLVEDHAVNRVVGVGLLRRLGVEPDLAEDGLQAVRALEAADYDLVLMDLQMPTMDGAEATRRIRASVPPERQPRIVALTANAFAETAEAVREEMDGYLTKPVRLDDLRAELERTAGTPVDLPPRPAAPARAAPGGLAVPSAEAVARHLRSLCDHDDALAVEILDAYLGTDRTLAELLLVPPQRAASAHKLKAAAGTLGADALAHAAYEIERDGRDGADTDGQAAALAGALGRLRDVALEARARLVGSPTPRPL